YPGWRLEDLEAARERIPEESNAALPVLRAGRALPARWKCAGEKPGDAERKRLDAVARFSPNQRLTSQTLQSLQVDLVQVGPALAEARSLVELAKGRFAVAWTSDAMSTPLPHLAKARAVANLLAYDVLLRSQKQETDQAFSACRALLNAGRS